MSDNLLELIGSDGLAGVVIEDFESSEIKSIWCTETCFESLEFFEGNQSIFRSVCCTSQESDSFFVVVTFGIQSEVSKVFIS